MPHIPRRLAPLGGVPPELQHRPVTPPPSSRGDKKDEEEKKPEKRLGLQQLDLFTYEPDHETVYKALFGREPDTDGYTGQLVYIPPDSKSNGQA